MTVLATQLQTGSDTFQANAPRRCECAGGTTSRAVLARTALEKR